MEQALHAVESYKIEYYNILATGNLIAWSKLHIRRKLMVNHRLYLLETLILKPKLFLNFKIIKHSYDPCPILDGTYCWLPSANLQYQAQYYPHQPVDHKIIKFELHCIEFGALKRNIHIWNKNFINTTMQCSKWLIIILNNFRKFQSIITFENFYF